ncbi:MAG TPA: hypothetical protein VF756_16985 [Thermoanaerobaculia bacterium]
MTKSTKRAAVVCTLLVVAALGIADVASACTQMCVRVSQFCRQCQDVGEYTGATCDGGSPCGCFYTQNTCGLGLAGIQAQADQAASEGPVCEPLPFAEEAEIESPVVMN